MSTEIVAGNGQLESRRLVTKSEWARLRGVSPCYVSKLLKERKIVDVQGKIDSVEADRYLEGLRQRVQDRRSNAAAIRQGKNTELETANGWREAILTHISNKEYVVLVDVLRDVVGIVNPRPQDRMHVARILNSAGWRQWSIHLDGTNRSVYVRQYVQRHKPQRTSLAEAILSLRTHFGEKQEEFATRLNIKTSRIVCYETNDIPNRHALSILRDTAAEAEQLGLAAIFDGVLSVRYRDDCAIPECADSKCAGSKYCEFHYRERERVHRRKLTAEDPKYRERRKRYRANGREQRNRRFRQRLVEDEDFRNRRVHQKRVQRFQEGIAAWCTKAYLDAAKQEDDTLTKALKVWLKSCRKPKTQEERAEIARKAAQEKYRQNPEAERRRVQAYKHSRPDYRERWNGARGAREAACSDGTLTKESVGALFAASKCCPYCGDRYKKSRRSLDHIVPLVKAKGRKLHSITNVLVCCRSCNCRKHAKGLTQFLEEVKSAKRKNASGSTVPNGIPSLFECLVN